MVKPHGKTTQVSNQMWPQYQVPRDRNTPVCTVSKAPKSPSHMKRTSRNIPPHRSPSVERYTTSDSESDPEIPILVPDFLSLHPGESEKLLSDEEIKGGQERESPKCIALDSTSTQAPPLVVSDMTIEEEDTTQWSFNKAINEVFR